MGGIRKIRLIGMSNKRFSRYLRRKGMRIGRGCVIGRDVYYGSEPYLISIGDHERINAGVQMITHDGGGWVLRDKRSGFGEVLCDVDNFGEIKIGSNVHIGTNAVIMPANSVVGGVPAKVIESLDFYAEKMQKRGFHTKFLNSRRKRRYLESYFKIKR